MIFKYTAFDENKKISGRLDAKSLRDCEEKLLKKGYRIVKIEEQNSLSLEINNSKFSDEELHILLYQFSILINSKINIPAALEIISKNYQGKKHDSLIRIYKKVIGGMSLSKAFEDETLFPKMVKNMIAIGENSSQLGNVFDNLSTYYYDLSVFKKKIQSTLIYPIILLITTLVIINFLVLNILPNFADIFENAGAELPLPTRILMSSALFIKKNLLIILLSIICILIFSFIYFKSSKGRYKLEKLLIKSNFYREIQVQRFITMMDFLVSSKVLVADALNIIEESIDNIHFKEEINEYRKNLYSGMTLSDSIRTSKFFDNIVISMIATGEKSATLDKIVKSLKEYINKKFEIDSKRFLVLIEPIIILLLAIFVGYVVLSIAIPMFDIVNYIG